MDPVSILGPLWEALGNHFGSQNVSKNRVKFRGRFLKVKKLKKVVKMLRGESVNRRGCYLQGGGGPDLDLSISIYIHICIERTATAT